MDVRPNGALTIGAFARLSRLPARALRRYDELGLLRPVHVDPFTGYRYYAEAQLERARLVAWLRRIGMPAARIRRVCDLYGSDTATGSADAARDIRAYWAQVEAETAARRDLATFLIDHLSAGPAGEGVTAMSDPTRPTSTSPLGIRYAARSDRGLVRETNQDAVYADDRLLAVADGYGRAGAPASTAAIAALKPSATSANEVQGGDLLNVLAESVERANQALDGSADSGTTLTAMVWTGSQLALVHIGDTRAYVLRDGEFFQITHDHTVVRSMIDEGTLTADEALSHPQRTMLLRALYGGEQPARPDLRLHDVRAGDRYLLCSDGLSTVVAHDSVRGVIATAAEPDGAVRELIALAREAGGPDNIACVVADVVEL
ncbi:regulatory protein [Streptomyces sp. 150FB]|uniref:MerR family transcriptional regulator n=1 Tax=Streptomyces sp. 150FB TaxID=1576605 RepID=UPI0005893A82|nr:MerR family transcriptional regulator [Streptomyces sp. 150FB]KIF75629.1 regulatory protein [Streptomyces sp. 150FB]